MDKHIKTYPLINYEFFIDIDGKLKTNGAKLLYDKDRLLYIISLFSLIPAYIKDNIFEDDYIPINSTFIRDKIIKYYKNYLDYSISTKYSIKINDVFVSNIG